MFIAHGRRDPVMEIELRAAAPATCSRRPASSVDYHESDAAHHIDPAHVPAAVAWVGRTLAPVA